MIGAEASKAVQTAGVHFPGKRGSDHQKWGGQLVLELWGTGHPGKEGAERSQTTTTAVLDCLWKADS